MNEMYGTYQHTIDPRGRLFMPARLREELGESFFVTISTEKCLNAFSSESWNMRMEKIKAMTMKEQLRIRPLFANAAKCDTDSQGRVLLPKPLRDFAGLDKNATIVGAGVFVQIWDSEEYAPIAARESTPENLADVLDELDF